MTLPQRIQQQVCDVPLRRRLNISHALTTLTESGVVVTVLSVWPAMLVVAVVAAHRFQFEFFGQGRQI